MENKTVDLSIICDVTCDYFELTPMEMLNNTRKRKIITARQWFQYLCRELNPDFIVPSSQIGAYLNDVTGFKYDHATVLHSRKAIKGYIEVSKFDKKTNDVLRNRIQQRIPFLIPEKDDKGKIKYDLTPPKNQRQLCLWYLYNWNNFSLKDVINDSMFFKFQTRLSEIECDLGIELAKRTRVEFTSRFGKKSTYNIYSALDSDKILSLYSK